MKDVRAAEGGQFLPRRGSGVLDGLLHDVRVEVHKAVGLAADEIERGPGAPPHHAQRLREGEQLAQLGEVGWGDGLCGPKCDGGQQYQGGPAVPRGVPTRVLVVSDAGDDSAELRKASDELLGQRALWMDDHVPPWYATDIDTPLERTTHARSMVELRVCARARRFVGNLAAPSTHAICNMRGTSKGGGRAGRAPTGCEDALGRTLPARWAFF